MMNSSFTFPTINMIKTGENIQTLRTQKGLSVKMLQNILGFGTPQAIYKWQQGLTLPSIDNLVALASILNVRIEDILAVDFPKNSSSKILPFDPARSSRSKSISTSDASPSILHPEFSKNKISHSLALLPLIDMNKTGEKICALRIQKGLSVRKLQNHLGFGTPQAIYKWQQGLTLPSIDNLVVLTSILGVSIEDVLVLDVPAAHVA